MKNATPKKKLSRKSGSLLVSPIIRKNTQSLISDWNRLNRAYHQFTKKQLEFARKIATIWARAKQLDGQQKGSENQDHLREQLRKIIRSDNKSILSRWVSIGQNASQLLPYANVLPPQRDSLYALSLAVENKQPIERWINKGKLSTESTVRQVIALTKKKDIADSPDSAMMDILKIRLPCKDGLKRFAKIQNDLETFLESKDLPFVYCGAYASYEKDLEAYQSRINKAHLRLVRKHVKDKILKKIDYTFFNSRHKSKNNNKPSLKAKLTALNIAPEEIDVRNCWTIEELAALYTRLELDEDGDWGEKIMALYAEASAKFEIPVSVKNIDAARESAIGSEGYFDTTRIRRNPADFAKLKV